jgi:acetoacetyl-CoA synthetase
MNEILTHFDVPALRGDVAAVDDRVRAIFERVLEQSPIGPDENFFDIGGTSMLAISLILELELLTGQELSISEIYNAPTIRAMSAALGTESAPDVSPLILLREGPAQPCLFLVHGMGGTVMELRPLARRIAGDLTVYGFQAIGLDGHQPKESIGAMADAYCEKIAHLQPQGPVYLAGYSLGGLIVFEMARRLQARGRDVRFIGLIDAYPDGGFSPRRLAILAAALARTPPVQRRAALRQLWENILFRVATRLGRTYNTPHSDDVSIPKSIVNVVSKSKKALQCYRPRALPCDVVFFQADQRILTFPPDPAPIWQPFVRRLAIHKVAGDHYSLVSAHVEELAVALGASLHAAILAE